MKKNLGIADRIVRFVLVDFLIGSAYMGFEIPGAWSTAAFIFAIVLVFSIIVGYSPVYHLFGWSTRDKPDHPPPQVNGA